MKGKNLILTIEKVEGLNSNKKLWTKQNDA